MKRFGLRTWFGLMESGNKEVVVIAAMVVELWCNNELKWSENRERRTCNKMLLLL